MARCLDGVERSEKREGNVKEEGNVLEAAVCVQQVGEEVLDAEVRVALVEGDAHWGVGGEVDVRFEGERVGGISKGDAAEGDGFVFEVVLLENGQEADEALDTLEAVQEGGDDGLADGAEEAEGESAG